MLSRDEFDRVLDELGLAAWHGAGRRFTETQVEQACQKAGLSEQLSAFTEGARVGAISLLAAFYFRQAHKIEGERTFEFTHKSFGEYLVVRRIVRWIEDIHEERERNRANRQRGWSEEEALIKWIEVTGPAQLDEDMALFLQREVALRRPEVLATWQKTLADLFTDDLHQGLPMHKLGLPTYRDMCRQAGNAEETLLAAHFSCASVTKDSSLIRWPSSFALHNLIGHNGFYIRHYLGWLGSHDDNHVHKLSWIDLIIANLRGTSLKGAYVYGASLEDANLEGAVLEKANLTRVNFVGANLVRANLTGATLREARLRRANLQGANLQSADLVRAEGLDRALGLDEVESWRGTTIERKWVERLGFDADKLGLKVVDDADGDRF